VNRRRAAETALVFNTLIWGSTFVLVKAALLDISPILFIALRFTLAAGALLAVFRRSALPSHGPIGDPSRSWRAVGAGAIAGVFLFSGYLRQTMGLRLTTAPRSAFITGLTSIAVPLLAALVYRVRPQISEVIGVLVATLGLALMTMPGVLGPMRLGDLLTVFCALAFAAHIVTLGHFSEQMSYELLSVAQIGVAAVLGWTLFSWVERPRGAWRPAVVWAILITGLLATALAFSIQSWAQRYTSPARTALIFMLEPIVAWITSYCIAGEGLSGSAAAGAALILGGVVLVELKPLNPRQHQYQ
jgi:drug/metabolite transporter (DMT)-like permease